MRAVLEGRDVVVVMPTGSGKSLCFQLPALEFPGVTLVLSPLIALMKDQVEALLRRGIPAAFINSSLGWSEIRHRLDEMRAGRLKLVYVAPERFRDSAFTQALKEINLSMIAVDEAHCVSQWGHDFRPDYLRIGRETRQFPKARVMALTATATGRVRDDIALHLGLGQHGRASPAVFVHGFERPNLLIRVSRVSTHAEKMARLLSVIDDWRFGIIYCSTRKQVEKVTAKLAEQGVKAPMYHGGLRDEQRAAMQEQFMSRQYDVVVATNAFGMGVDRGDVRFVMHWDVPGSMEAYYQEIGRAGRDGAPAWCELLYNYADVRTQEFFLEGANPSRETVLELLALVRRRCSKAPLARSAEDWAEDLKSTRNPMAVRSAFSLLDHAGCIRREAEAGGRTLAVMAEEKVNAEALAAQLLRAESKAERDRARLDAMLAYVGRRQCRHAQILRYFGEKVEREACRACDVCVDMHGIQNQSLSEEDWVALQKILSTVARLDGQYGRARIAELLKGSKTHALLQAHLDTHRGYGLLADWSLAEIMSTLDELLRDGCLEQAGGEFPTLSITDRGREAVWRRVQPAIKVGKIPRGFQADAKGKAAKKPATGISGNVELYEKLKAWRLARAKQGRLKPFQVLNNRTLDAIATHKPHSPEELQKIPGIGPAKLKLYGPEILDLVGAFPAHGR